MASPKTVTTDETVSIPAPSTPLPATLTRWDAFEKAQLVPVSIVCDGAPNFHRVNLGCHSKLLMKVDSLLTHLDADHGGGFVFEFRKTDGKPWAGWAELRSKGVELVSFTCDVCDKDVPLHPQQIANHMRPHSGKMKRAQITNKFNVTIATEKPITSEDEAYSDF